MTCLYDFSATDIEGRPQALSQYRGQVVLIVNVASKCGFTPQYAGLQALYEAYRARGFALLGFPCDQFRHQEPGSESAIREFCTTEYGVTFPLFAKIHVNGPQAHPLYQWLKQEKRGVLGTPSIKWNFTKFLIERDGVAIQRYASTATPARIRADIERALAT